MSLEAAQVLQLSLLAASRDPVHRPRVLAALRGAEVLAATWPTDPTTLRTLTTSQGVTLLPLFSAERQLEDAAARYGWLSPDGRVPSRHLHISEAIRSAKQQRAAVLVIDIAADHAFSLDEGEMDLLSVLPSMRPAAHADTGRLVSMSRPPSDGREALRISTRPPPPAPDPQTGLRALPSALKPTSVTPTPDGQAVSATFGATPTATMEALTDSPSDEMLEALTQVLREFPEVEWACLLRADRGGHRPVPSIALRIEPAFRRHLSEIGARLREASCGLDHPLEVLVLDTAEQMKQARNMGLPFYPWRKR